MEYQLVLFSCVLLCYLPHLLLRIPAIFAKLANNDKGLKTYDIRAPRVSQALAADDTPEGRYIARLTGHHNNSHEVFPILAAAIFSALHRGVPVAVVNFYASAFLASRVLYTFLYICGTSAAFGYTRALVWTAGLVLCGYLMAFA